MKKATLISVDAPEGLAEGQEVSIWFNVRNDGDEVSDFYIISFDITDPAHWDTWALYHADGVHPGQTVSIPLKDYWTDKWKLMPAKNLPLYIQGGYYETTGTHGKGIQQFIEYLTIKLTTEPAPQEGEAEIWRVDAPMKLLPGEKITILAHLWNKGLWRDDIWCNLIDLDTGEILVSKTYNAGSHEGFMFDMSNNIIMPSNDFRLRLIAGHNNEPDSIVDIIIYLAKAAPPIPPEEKKFPWIILLLGIPVIPLIFLLKKK